MKSFFSHLLCSTLLLPAGLNPIIAGSAPPTFVERLGIVAIEAEHFTDNVGPWEEVEGRNATENLLGLTHDYRLEVRDPRHPLAAGLQGQILLPSQSPIPWAMPGNLAVPVIVAGHDHRKAVVFGFERGAPLDGGGTSPARRVITTAPLVNVPAFRQLFDAAITWAGEGHATRVLLIANTAERAEDDLEIEAHLKKSGLEVSVHYADEFRTEQADGAHVVVVPASARVEKLHGKLRKVSVPIVLAGKTDVAQDMGLTPPPMPVPGAANAVMIRTGKWTDHVRYGIHFSQPGDYRLWLLGQNGGTEGSDEAVVFFDQPPEEEGSAYFKMRLPPSPGWSSEAFSPRPGGAQASVPGVVRVEQPGWHTLYVAKGAEPKHSTPEPPPASRYPNWRIDKLVLARAHDFQPVGDGPDETRNPGEHVPPPAMLVLSEFMPRQIWQIEDGSLVLEAEALDHDPFWVEKTAPSGFTGRCYLEWGGPDIHRTIEGLFGNDDHRHIRQGAMEWSLILRVVVDEPGIYRMDVRNHHRMKDGDNDCWVSLVGARGTPDNPIVRLGDSLRDGPGFSWLDWGIPRYDLKPGLTEIRVGGRSAAFGVDRIVFYREDDPKAKARALDIRTAAARPITALRALHDFTPVSDEGFVPYYRDIGFQVASRQALAIDASLYPKAFAGARAVFPGPAGEYDAILTTVTENDGESRYRLRVDGQLLAEQRNPARADHSDAELRWSPVRLQPGSVIQVESNTESNGLIPEGDSFGWSRGRWTELRLVPRQGS